MTNLKQFVLSYNKDTDMSLHAIEEAIEKVALFAPGLGKVMTNAAKSPAAWKSVGKKALVGAGVGAVGNVALGDKDQSIMERATKGAIGGGAAGGLYGAGRIAYKANKGLTAAAAKAAKPVANVTG